MNKLTMEKESKENSFYASSRKEWRKWLTKNAALAAKIWLIIYHKNANKPSLTYEEAVEEALCFGWIDSKPNKRDKESYYLYFAQRKAGSNWSNINRQRAEKMILAKQMTPRGLELIELSKKTGTWLALKEVQASVVPPDLKKALEKNKEAKTNFEQFPPSSKRIILEWILNAKREETRAKRISETVELAAKGIKANHYRQ
jgi:uncharacterized protein YdeI (YjbR/CyaY-like superfamily)